MELNQLIIRRATERGYSQNEAETLLRKFNETRAAIGYSVAFSRYLARILD